MTAPRHRPGGCGEAGFSLIEVLAAVTITAVMIGLATQALQLMAGGAARGARQADRLEEAARAMAVVRQDLQRLQRAVTLVSEDEPRFVFEGGRSSMSFVVVDPAWPTGSGSYLVTYEIVGSAAKAALTRSRVPYPEEKSRTARRSSEAEEKINVLEGPFKLELLYLQRQGGRDDWLPEWKDRMALPHMIRIEATSTVAGVASLPTLVVRPRIEMETACLYGGQGRCSAGSGRLRAGPPAGQQGRQEGERGPQGDRR
jgi:prepilin-type N-terminal cleavage/methylation domain-containing protein